MRTRPVLGGVAILLLLAAGTGGGFLVARHEGERRFADAVARIRAAVGPSGSFTFERSTVHPFTRSAVLDRVALRSGDGTLFTADHVSVATGSGGHLRRIHADAPRLARAGATITASTLDATDLDVPPPPPGATSRIDPAAITFADATVDHLSIATSQGTAMVAAAAISNYGAGRPAALQLSDAVLRVPGSDAVDRLDLARLDATGLDLASGIDALEHQRQPPPSPATVSLAADGFTMGRNGDHLLQIDRMRLDGVAGPGKPNWARASVSGITITPIDDAMRTQLQQIGLDRLHGDITLADAYDPVAHSLKLSSLSVTVDDLGTVVLALDVSHFDLSAFQGRQPNFDALETALSVVALDSAHLRITDAGALSRFIALAARQSGIPPAALRDHLATLVRDDLGFAVQVPDAVLRTALAHFLSDGGGLDLRMRPASPLNVSLLAAEAAAQPAALFATAHLSSRWFAAADPGAF